MTWKPHTTVAAVIERDGQFLMVEEEIDGRVVFNQPAGHLDPNESLHTAVIRETREETAWSFVPQAITGIYLWQLDTSQRTYLRVAFCGSCSNHDMQQKLDVPRCSDVCAEISRLCVLMIGNLESSALP